MFASEFEIYYCKAHLSARSPKASRAAASKASSAAAPAEVGCKACHFVALLGHQNGNAHLRVPPCTWVRKTTVSRKRRAVEEPAVAASGSAGDTIASVAVIEAGPAPAVGAVQRLQ